MSRKPVHDIQIIHSWIQVERIESVDGSATIIRNCPDCGEEGRIFDLSKLSGPSLSDMPHEKRIAEKGKIGGLGKAAIKMLDGMTRELLDDTDYCDIADLLNEIEQRYQGQIQAGYIPYRELGSWIDTRTKKFQRKGLLAYKQGLVCNKCDSIVFSLDQLTEDHIIPRASGGQSILLNLQLLCRGCNQAKDNKSPNEEDVPPFLYQGPPCIHRITCVGVDELRRSYGHSIQSQQNPRT